jgi:phenylalanyl-tRNA synthetase beta chain
MKFSQQWLNEWLSTKLSTDIIVERLTDLGLEVDTVESAAGAFTGVLVGEILSADQHPDADRLRCCRVNVGDDQPLDIVCGGVNARAGIKVAVAVVGAVLPGDFKIKRAKLRGQPSFGMICSASELGMKDDVTIEGGIMELSLDAPVGTDFAEYLSLDDTIIDIELTPNRGDCACLHGIAREIAVAESLEIVAPSWSPVSVTSSDRHEVNITVAEECPVYCSRVISGIDLSRKTPLWMQERLRRSGCRRVNSVVDVLNYVMLELGQPLHAFNRSSLEGPLTVRHSKEGETIELLGGQSVVLAEGVLVIADNNAPQAVAGVMGNVASSVQSGAVDIVLESAFFNPQSIRRAANTMNIQTDASYRFERGVDYSLQREAMERATALLVDLVGGVVGELIECRDEAHQPVAPTVALRYEQIERILGVDIHKDKALQILQGLGFTLLNENSPWHFRVPSYRFDCEQEIDLIEECARVFGYGNIPAKPLSSCSDMHMLNTSIARQLKITKLLNQLGYTEAVTYSFVDPEWQAEVMGTLDHIVKLKNPISQDMSVMRQSCWPGLLKALQFNFNRQQHSVRMLEIGKVFFERDGHIEQLDRLAMITAGPLHEKNWRLPVQNVDFFSLKADVEALLSDLGVHDSVSWHRAEHSLLHPGQSAELRLGSQTLALLGAVHPRFLSTLGVPCVPVVFELDLSVLPKDVVPQLIPVGRFPAVKRDLAVVVSIEVDVQDLIAAAREATDKTLYRIEIFDIYQGESIEFGKKSVALGLTFLDPSRTLIDEEVDQAMECIFQGLGKRFNATMRV